MKFIETEIDGVIVVEPDVYRDDRGYFTETFSHREFEKNVCRTVFVQDNQSFSRYGVVRALHYQLPPVAQSKLVRVVEGAILDVAVDIRLGSPTFGKYVARELSGTNHRQLFVPRGFAHGFLCLTEKAIVAYKCDNYYSPGHEAAIVWNDPDLAIGWGIDESEAVVSDKDGKAPFLKDARLFDYSEKLY